MNNSLTQSFVKSKPPKAPAPNAAIIPTELKDRAQWVVWRYWKKGDKWTKVPFDARTGKHASTTNQDTWASFDEAWKAYKAYETKENGYAGIGFVFTPVDPYSGFDFDHCLTLNADTGAFTITPEAEEWVDRFATYTEISPSQTGLKGICRASAAHSGKNTKAKVELYDHSRFFTVTGHSWHAEPKPIANAQTVADEFCAKYFPPKEPESKRTKTGRQLASLPSPLPSTITTDKRLEKAFAATNGAKIQRLFLGDCLEHANDQSSADLALCALLAFYSEGSEAELDAMFRRSALMREKWDERHHGDGRTYGEMTVQKALNSCREFYEWHEPSPMPAPDKTHAEESLFDQKTFETLLRTPKGIARIHEATTAVLTEMGFSASSRGLISAIIGQIGRNGARPDEPFELPLVSLGCLLFKLDAGLKGEKRKQRLRNIKDQTRLKLKQTLAEQEAIGLTFLQYEEGRLERTSDGQEIRISSKFTAPGVTVIQQALRLFPQFARKRSGMKRAAQQAVATYRLKPQPPGRIRIYKPRDNRAFCERQTVVWAQKFAAEFPDKRTAFLHLADRLIKLSAEETCDKNIPLPPEEICPSAIPLFPSRGGGGLPPSSCDGENVEMHDFAGWQDDEWRAA